MMILLVLLFLSVAVYSFDVMMGAGKVATTERRSPGVYDVAWHLRVHGLVKKQISQRCIPCGELQLPSLEKKSEMVIDPEGRVLLSGKVIVESGNDLCRLCLLQLMTGEAV